MKKTYNIVKEKRLIFVVSIISVLLILVLPLIIGSYYVHILILVFLNVVLVLGYRLLYVTGLASFCHITFMAIGGYTSAILATKLALPFGICFMASGIISGISAILLGWVSVRARPIYFFLVSFGFFEVLDSVFSHWGLTGSYAGLSNIPPILGITTVKPYYYFTLIFCVLTFLFMYRLDRSRVGTELLAIGDDEVLAEASGLNVVGLRVLAFTIGAGFAGFAGSLHAHYLGYINPGSFSLWGTIAILIWCVVGGARKLWGPMAAAIGFTIINEFIHASGFLSVIIYATILLIAVMLLPYGIVGLVDILQQKGLLDMGIFKKVKT